MAEERDEAGVVQVHVADEDMGPAIPGVTGVDTLQTRRGADRHQVGNLAAGSRLEAEREMCAAGGVLAAEVKKAARVAVLDQEFESGRVAGVEEGEQSACGAHGEPTIIGRGGDPEAGCA